jgi:hypothetical protein
MQARYLSLAPVMSILILCKTKHSYDKYRGEYPKQEGFNVILYDECSLCGVRAEHIVLVDDWSIEEFKEIVMPRLISPTNLNMAMKIARYEKILREADIPLNKGLTYGTRDNKN